VKLSFDGSKSFLRIPRCTFLDRRRLITTVVKAQLQTADDSGGDKEDVNKKTHTKDEEKSGQMKKRVVFGVGIGLSVGGIVLAGGWIFTIALAAAVFIGAREYFELVRSRGISEGMTPPPRYVSRVCSVICALMPLITLANRCICDISGILSINCTTFTERKSSVCTIKQCNVWTILLWLSSLFLG
jgi:phosphatidate cytidylyltransferase